MRTTISISTRLLLAGIAALGALQVGCAGAPLQQMSSGSGVPASQGTVQATAAENGNTAVAIRVAHLARPAMVQADATVYVVWIQPRNASPQSVGAMALNDNLEGSLDTITPHRRFTVTVTPEPSAMVARPTHEAVFSAEVNRAVN